MTLSSKKKETPLGKEQELLSEQVKGRLSEQ